MSINKFTQQSRKKKSNHCNSTSLKSFQLVFVQDFINIKLNIITLQHYNINIKILLTLTTMCKNFMIG